MPVATITTVTDVEYYPLMKNAYIVRTTVQGNSRTFEVNDKNLKLLLAGKEYKPYSNKMFHYLSPENVEILRKNNWGIKIDHMSLWDAAKAGLTNESTLIGRGNYYSHDAVMRFYDGRDIPCGIVCDYIAAAMSDRAYDVNKAYDILSKNPNVHHLEKVDIPYYNDGGKALFFVWEVPEDLWKTIGGDSLTRHALIFDNDWLGLRAGGAALFDNFYKRIERERDDDDDY